MFGWLTGRSGKKQLQTQVEQLTEMLTAIQARIAADEAEKEKDKEPYCHIITEGIGENGMTTFELDWNDAFIVHLKENGFTGPTDEDIVNQYLNAIMIRHQRPDLLDSTSSLETRHDPIE